MNKLSKLLSLLLLPLIFGACGDGCEPITDYYPVTMSIEVSDSKGNDLLKDTAFVQSLTFDYNGTTYTVPFEAEVQAKPLTRYYMAWFQSPWLWKYTTSTGEERAYIGLGEWAGDDKWDNETVRINWPNGKHNDLSFTLKKLGCTNATYYLDGKKHSGSTFEFTYE